MSLIPASPPSSIGILRQGATCRTTTPVPGHSNNNNVPVHDLGGVIAGDTIQVGVLPTAPPLAVVSVDPATNSIVVNNGGSDIEIAAMTRLVVRAPGAKFYNTPMGTDAGLQTLVVESVGGVSTGRVRAYVRERRFDYVVTVDGVETWHFDCEGGLVFRG